MVPLCELQVPLVVGGGEKQSLGWISGPTGSLGQRPEEAQPAYLPVVALLNRRLANEGFWVKSRPPPVFIRKFTGAQPGQCVPYCL